MSDTQETLDEAASASEKPKRPRSRKKVEEAAQAQGAAEQSTPKKRPTPRRAAVAADADAPTEEAPKARRSRSSKEASQEDTPAPEEASAKPKRTRTRKKASEGEDIKEPSASQTADTPALEETPDEKDASSEKATPKRATVVRRRDRESASDRPEAGQTHEETSTSDSSEGSKSASPAAHSNKKNNNRHQKNRHDNRNREAQPSVTQEELAELKVADLRERAALYGLDAAAMKKAELVEALYGAICKAEGFEEVTGILDIMPDGYGFLRTSGYLPGENDIYVGLATIRKNNLRKGDMVTGQTRPARPNDKFAALQKVIAVGGKPVEVMALRPKFADLTPVFPDERLLMEHGKNTITARVIDLVSPIGKGQRGLIVSPPKAGKTTVLKDIAASISANNPDVHLMYLGIDERPEEATDMERSIRGEVVSSTFDMPSENHIQVAELVIERAKRLVEEGKDVVILLDSITRLARAYNLAQPASGRILSGGVDSTALYPPKRFLGAARNIENGGSLTILASALIETGSKMDEVIFEEFKGTGNMELKLDRALADRRIFPAIDPITSGTRKEELLMDPQEAPLIWGVRRILSNTNSTERAMDMLIKSLKQTNSNQEFLLRMAKKMQTASGRPEEMEL